MANATIIERRYPGARRPVAPAVLAENPPFSRQWRSHAARHCLENERSAAAGAGRLRHTAGMDIRVWKGDITTLDVDAIVNAANNTLFRGGGVCGAIFRAAGRELDDACDAIGWCETGDAVVTPGFDLAARWVIHAVGPVWEGGRDGEPEQLASCYARVLGVATEIGARSIAIPAISTGIYGFPPHRAAVIAVTTLAEAEAPAVDEMVLVAFDDETQRRYEGLLAQGP